MNFRIEPFAVVIALLIAGCGGGQSIAPLESSPGSVHNHVVQDGKVPINWTQFSAPSGFGTVQSVVAGPDKNIWFAEEFGNRIGLCEQLQL